MSDLSTPSKEGSQEDGLIDYVLPPELIAQTPLKDRSASRMLVLHRKSGSIEHRQFTNFPEYLEPGDTLVLNETRVTSMRLYGHKIDAQGLRGARVEALLMKRRSDGLIEALTRPAKRLAVGANLDFGRNVQCRVMESLGEGMKLLDFGSATLQDLEAVAVAPTPPYVKTPLSQLERYQTVYSHLGVNPLSAGSAAAPTAGLHITESLLSQLGAKKVAVAKVDLEIGLDTFRPISSLQSHEMHGERCSISPETAQITNQTTGRVFAVGTTTTRTLETLSELDLSGRRSVQSGQTVSRLFIRPGYRFKAVDAILTNFHMPKTTMLSMLSAFASSDAIAAAYTVAVAEKYRFLSFGDCMLIL